ncbi:CRISPR-associated endonuclease/helicase Cas3 [Nocardia sp. GAS34]|uniref:CRISPR-associated helicase Cas3' n=1 Tax=unclassified Nocardia TaxID=2637762 RepID=UPI003D240CBF
MVSDSTRSAWAKSDRDGGSLSLLQHLSDSVGVAGVLWDCWLPRRTREVISAALPEGEADGRLLLRWLAGIHDIGKLTPAFACQVPVLADVMHAKGLRFGAGLSNRKALPHGLAGQVEVERFLRARGWDRVVARSYAVVVGSHHGLPPTRGEVQVAGTQLALLGDGEWSRCREELLTYITDSVVGVRLEAWRTVALPVTVQVLLTAAVIVADWIASNQDLFPLNSARVPGDAVAAWTELGLPAPWIPGRETDGALLLQDRFDLPGDVMMRPLQAECVAVAERIAEPGLMIVEAPMGEGKTEAALLAAEILVRRFGFGGVFIALPTMATSNAMFDRVVGWAKQLTDAPGSMFLAHGKAALNPVFAELKHRGFASIGTDCGDSGVLAHAWYVGKKGPLANVVVGTIDQVLRGGLKVRHVMLRHLALANKVVVIDEVHAADSYMSTYLCRCLEWLGAYQVPVLLLSATLPPAQRNSLLRAYQRGRTGGSVPQEDVPVPRSYPSVIAWPMNEPPAVVPASGRSVPVRVAQLGDDDGEVIATVRDALSEGGVVGIVCNTVTRAQAIFTALRDCGEFTEDQLLLVHSRFIASHRGRLEDRLRSRLGPPGKATRPRPPERFVVVGTQVIEQSLDIDVDLLITDLAPMDLLLQRIGRLHRHARDQRPGKLIEARCLVRGVDWAAAVPVPAQGSVAVYGAARLLRAASILEALPDGLIRIPQDVPLLVGRAYAEPFDAAPRWRDVIAEADAEWSKFCGKQQDKAGTYLLPCPYGQRPNLQGWLAAGVPEDSEGVGGQAQVRDAEDTIEAIVVRRGPDGVRVLEQVPDFGGRLVPTDTAPEARLAKALAGCTIRLPAMLTRYGRMDAVLGALEETWYPGWQQSHWLAGELVLELDEHDSAIVAGHNLTYDPILGLLIERIEKAK